MPVSSLTDRADGHRFRVGDANGAAAELLQGERARIFYTDPPWGPGKMKYFETLAEKATGVRPPARDYRDLLRDLAQQAALFTDGPVFFEYGVQWRDEVVEICQSTGLRRVATVKSHYDGGTLDIHVFAPPVPAIDLGRLAEADYLHAIAAAKGMARVTATVGAFTAPGTIIMDLCCGFGGRVQAAAVKYKMRFFGNELNANRLARAIQP